jgi:hypothetical protein
MNNAQNCDSYVNIPSSQTYRLPCHSRLELGNCFMMEKYIRSCLLHFCEHLAQQKIQKVTNLSDT